MRTASDRQYGRTEHRSDLMGEPEPAPRDTDVMGEPEPSPRDTDVMGPGKEHRPER